MSATHSSLSVPMRALIVRPEQGADTATGRAFKALIEELDRREIEVINSSSVDDAEAILAADTLIQCVLVHWDLADDKGAQASEVISAARAANHQMPIFLTSDRSSISTMSADILTEADDYIWVLEDTVDFIGGRIRTAIDRYRQSVLPPMFRALAQFSRVYKYSWHTPGHTGGTAFLKSVAGNAFFRFFGETMFRTDLSISVGELGSLLDHSGPIGAGERYTAGVFGSHRSYYVTNGSSMSNRVILMASVTRGQVALCDRNCHKSVEHAMTMSGASPVYLVPNRNALGLIGPIPPSRLTPKAIEKMVADNKMMGPDVDRSPVHAVITNSTYDGLCYNVARIEELLGETVDRLHLDEAWFGYARFNPLYAGRFAMHGDPKDHAPTKPTMFSTQSTHKLLAALSQASMIHIRDGRRPIDHARFNEAFMMHASTSPNYAILASCDVASAMMDKDGEKLTGECISEAIAFRQKVAAIAADSAKAGGWFFDCWQPTTVADPKSGKTVPFHKADPETLATTSSAWLLEPGAEWHGFAELEDGWCMLDPIKVSIVAPGMSPNGELARTGIPAPIVTAYLGNRGVVVEKTTDFTMLVLFSMGITKGKWGTLLNALLDFRSDYDSNAPLEHVLPELVENAPETYAGMGLHDLADRMFKAMGDLGTTRLMGKAYEALPVPTLPPVDAYEELVRGNVERVSLAQLAGRTAATGVVPYPPGIPILMPGEQAGADDGPIIGYLRGLEKYDALFPGFEHHTHGIEVEDGVATLLVLKEKS
ncbi:MAG: arginine decarboxylase [Brevundimonas sp.]|nr:MAG: arginine decarboxylase [Brevundimonas sp.]